MVVVDERAFSPLVDGWGTHVRVSGGRSDQLLIALETAAERFCCVDAAGFEMSEAGADARACCVVIPRADGYELLLDCGGPVSVAQGETLRVVLRECLSAVVLIDGVVRPVTEVDRIRSEFDNHFYDARVKGIDVYADPERWPAVGLVDLPGRGSEEVGTTRLVLRGEPDESHFLEEPRPSIRRFYPHAAEPGKAVQQLHEAAVARGWTPAQEPSLGGKTWACLLSWEDWLMSIEAFPAAVITGPEFRPLRRLAPATVVCVAAVKNRASAMGILGPKFSSIRQPAGVDELLLPEHLGVPVGEAVASAEVRSLVADPAPRVRWVRRVGMFESMAAADGVLYVVDEGTTAFDLTTSAMLWRVDRNSDNLSSGDVRIGVTPTRVQVDAPGEYYVEFDRNNGRPVASRHSRPRGFVPLERPESPMCHFDDDGAVVGLVNGHDAWRIDLQGDPMVDGQLLAVGTAIVVATADQRVIVLE